MIITDTHTHLYSDQFNEDRNEMMQRALDAGVARFFIPAIDSTYLPAMLDLEKSFPKNTFLMMGLHPCYVKDDFEKDKTKIDTKDVNKIMSFVDKTILDEFLIDKKEDALIGFNTGFRELFTKKELE